MKKFSFSDNMKGKGSKGFYTALCISAAMIGSACWFAYEQGEKLSDKAENIIAEETPHISRDAAVDKKSTDIPKPAVTNAVTYSQPTVTTAVLTVTVPAAATIPVTAADAGPDGAYAEETAADAPASFQPPLDDISNVLAPFSNGELVKNETTGSWQTHNGADIAAEAGTDVKAVCSGEVTAVNDDPLWGTTVVIDHKNGYITKYCSLSKDVKFQKGDSVSAGDTIGIIGDTADIESSLPPHLHFECVHNGCYEDPISLINS